MAHWWSIFFFKIHTWFILLQPQCEFIIKMLKFSHNKNQLGNLICEMTTILYLPQCEFINQRIVVFIQEKLNCKLLSGEWWPSCLDLNWENDQVLELLICEWLESLRRDSKMQPYKWQPFCLSFNVNVIKINKTMPAILSPIQFDF